MSIEKRRIERKEGRSLVANRGTIEYAGRMVSINGESSMIHDGMYLDDPRDKAIFVQRLQLSVGHSTSSGLQSVKEKAVELVPKPTSLHVRILYWSFGPFLAVMSYLMPRGFIGSTLSLH